MAPPAAGANDSEDLGGVTLAEQDNRTRSIITVAPADLPSYVQRIYHVKPDRRFLYAIAEVGSLTADRTGPSVVRLQLTGSGWKVAWNGMDVGNLPEIPRYPDLATLLARWASARLQKARKTSIHPELPESTISAVQRGSAREVIQSLAALNQVWKRAPFDPALVRLAAQGYVWLSLQRFDELDLADPLLGKALAFSALSDALKAGSLADEETLLCDLLGYESAAKGMAARLDSEDPARLYVERNEAVLRRISLAPAADRRIQYLYLLVAAESEDAAQWFGSVGSTQWGEHLSIPLLAAAMKLDDFGATPACASAIEDMAFLSLKGPPSALPSSGTRRKIANLDLYAEIRRLAQEAKVATFSPPESRTAMLEAAVALYTSEIDGPILDRNAVRAYYRSAFYSSLYAQARYLFDEYASTAAAKQFGERIVDPSPGTASELKKWILDRVALRDGGPVTAVSWDLANLSRIGVKPLERIRYSLYISTSATDPEYRRPMACYLSRLDSRPAYLSEAATVAYWHLFDFDLTEKFLVPAAEMSPAATGEMLARCALWRRDKSWLMRIVRDASLPPSTRAEAAGDLAQLHAVNREVLRSWFLEIARADRRGTSSLATAVSSFRKIGSPAQALPVIDDYLSRHGQREDLIGVEALVLKARVLEDESRFAEAWATLRPALSSWTEDVMVEASRVLGRLGNATEALRIARDCHERYHDGYSAVQVVDALWRGGRWNDAAMFLGSSQQLMVRREWNDLGARFADVFEERPAQEVSKAFRTLLSQSLDQSNLVDLPAALGSKGRHQMAFDLMSQMPGSAASFVDIQLRAFDELKEVKGKTEAMRWLLKKLLPKEEPGLQLVAFEGRRFDLLWALPDPPNPDKNDILHLLRAASLLQTREMRGARWDSLVKYFKARQRKKNFVIEGLFLLNQASVTELLSGTHNIGDVCTRGWIMGEKLESEGRLRKATRWFEVSLETEMQNLPPHLYAYTSLLEMLNRGKFLDVAGKTASSHAASDSPVEQSSGDH